MEKSPVMYIFVNTDLKMSAGKVAGQVGHLVQSIIEDILKMQVNTRVYKKYLEWCENGSSKIILKASYLEIKELLKNPCAFHITDAGKTQIPTGSITVVGFCPDVTSQYAGYKLY